jgi:hypothetical protein
MNNIDYDNLPHKLAEQLAYAEDKKTLSKEKNRHTYEPPRQFMQPVMYHNMHNFQLRPRIINNMRHVDQHLLQHKIPSIDTLCLQQGYIKKLAKAPVLLKRPTPKKSPTKKSPTKTSPTKKSPTKTSPTKKSPTKTSPTKKSPTKTSPTKKSPTKTSPTKKPTVLNVKAVNPKFVPVKTPGVRNTMTFY